MSETKMNSNGQIIFPDWCHGSTDDHECMSYSYNCFKEDGSEHQHCKGCSVILNYDELCLYCVECNIRNIDYE